MTANNKISTLFPNQVPFFIREDYPDAVVFFQKYYEFLEQSNVDFRSGYSIERLITHLQTIDIDNTDHDEAAEYLYKKFIRDIPLSIEADKSILLKHIKDFYRAKGTEKATKFLIYALTGHANTSLYYPKQDILKASDGKWFIQKTLRIANTWINGSSDSSLEGLQLFLGQQIIGETSNASAIVETTNRFYEQGSLIDELVLSNIQGDFQNGEKILSNDGYETHLYGGFINTITIRNGGIGYNVGDPVIVVSNTGAGACVVVSGVSTGNISSMLVDYGGAGFHTNDQILVSGGGGSGATAIVYIVDNSGSVHPNSYNIVAATIGLEGNTTIGNTLFSNLVPAVSDPANSSIANSMLYFQYSNVGPIQLVYIVNPGTNYTSTPTMDVVSNTIVRNSGILGRMSLNNGGIGYQVGDEIEFINVVGGYGTGARGNVTSVDGSGVITGIAFKQMAGHYIGGEGYNQSFLPRANVISTTGSGANVTVTAILGDGEFFGQTGNTPIGSIEEISIINKGVNYDDTTTLDLTGSGDGNANATVTTIEGVISFPGRFLNDDGFLSAYNFLQDQHYYQPYSYVIRTDVPMTEYATTMKKLGHPSGLKMFGEYINKDQTDSISYDIEDSESTIFTGDTLTASFRKYGNVVVVYSSGISTSANNSDIQVEFINSQNEQKNWVKYSELPNGWGDLYSSSVLLPGNTTNVVNVMPEIFGGNGTTGLYITANSTANNLIQWYPTENISRFLGNTMVFSAYFQFDDDSVVPNGGGGTNIVLFYMSDSGMTASWEHITGNIWRAKAYRPVATIGELTRFGFYKWKTGLYTSINCAFTVSGAQLEVANSDTGIANSLYPATEYQSIGNTWIDDGRRQVSNGRYNIVMTKSDQFYFSTATGNNANGNVIISVQNYRPYNTVSFVKNTNVMKITQQNHGLSNGSNIHYRTTSFNQTIKNFIKMSEYQQGWNNIPVHTGSVTLANNTCKEAFNNVGITGVIYPHNLTNIDLQQFLIQNVTNSFVTLSWYMKMYDGAGPPTVGSGATTIYPYSTGIGAWTASNITLVANSVYRVECTKQIATIKLYDIGLNKLTTSDNRACELTGVQIEYGNIATDYETSGMSFVASNTYITPNGVYTVSNVTSNTYTINTPKQNNAIGNAKVRIV